jgi:peptide/nickel transport system substrate-binding protein
LKRAIFTISVLLACIFILAGCSSSSTKSPTTSKAQTSTSASTQTSAAPTSAATSATTSAKPKYGGTLRWVLTDTVEVAGGWIPELFVGTPTQVQLVYEPLLHCDSKGNLIPWLAEKYQIAADSKSITFNLRKGVKFHDGSDFNAAIAKWNLDNFITSKRALWTTVDIIDDYTIRTNLAMPVNNSMMTGGMSGFSDAVDTWMASKKAYDDHGGDNGGKAWLRDNPVGTGPFKFASYTRDVSFKTVRNENYWRKDADGNQLPYLNGFEITYITDPLTRKASLLAGQLDIGSVSLGPDSIELGKNANLVLTPSVSTIYEFTPDSGHPNSPFSKLAVRQAVEYGLDREAVAKAFGYGYWQAPYQMGAPDSIYYDPNYVTPYKHDVAKAKQLLTEAGYPNGFNCAMVCSPTGVNRDIVLAFKEQLAEVGIKADVQYPDAAKYIPEQMSGKQENVLYLEPIGGTVNWNASLVFSFNPARLKAAAWSASPEYAAAFNASVNATTLDIKLVKAVFAVIDKECSLIPAYAGGTASVKQKYVRATNFNDRGFSAWFNADTVWFDK